MFQHRIPACLLLACVGTLFVAGGCQKKQSAPEQRYDLTGKVVAVNRTAHELTISHQDIPGYMRGMTMPFRVKDDWVFDAVAPGDQVSATLVVSDDSHLENVVVTKQSQAGGAPAGAHVPEVGEQPPDFAFVNQDGKRVRLSTFRGKALVLTFIYTRCPLPDYCIRMSNNFGALSKDLKKNAALYRRTQLLSISFDPEYDQPKVLREYGTTYAGDVDPSFTHWQFVTGTPEEIKKAADFFGISYTKDSGQIVHSLRTALIGPDGKIVQLFPGNGWKPADVAEAIRSIPM